MKNNRQIGLNGRIFISNSLHSNAIFVFLLMAGGLLTAFADILKLTGSSGAQMSSFTTTLLLYDFVVSLMLIVVVFYAFFLECGDCVPVIREKPLMAFGLFRLGYYILLSYYICYRALYCVTHTETVSVSLFFFYIVQFALVFMLILANCFVYNILSRNMIRRSYIKSFHRLATVGIIVQLILPIVYIIARALMAETGDEYFTASPCDLLRLCICPLFSIGVWFLYISAIDQVKGVFDEVDNALRDRRYQITYTAPDYSERKSGKKNAVASTAFMPAPPKKAAIAGEPEKKALPSHSETGTTPAATAPKKNTGSGKKKEKTAETAKSNAPTNAAVAAATAINPEKAIPVVDAPVMTDPVTQEAYVAVPVPVSSMPSEYTEGTAPGGVVLTAVPLVQEYDPVPKSIPLEQARKNAAAQQRSGAQKVHPQSQQRHGQQPKQGVAQVVRSQGQQRGKAPQGGKKSSAQGGQKGSNGRSTTSYRGQNGPKR